MFTDRPLTFAHAVTFVGVCAAGGFCVGVGLAALASTASARRVLGSLGWG